MIQCMAALEKTLFQEPFWPSSADAAQSSTANLTFPIPERETVCLAESMNVREKSKPKTSPEFGATAAAICKVREPSPQPRSKMRSPG